MAIDDAVTGPADWELKNLADDERREYVRAVKEDAVAWVMDGKVEVGSFVWVCGVLKLEADYVRATVRTQIAKGAN